MKIRDIGEQGLLVRLQKFCPPEIIGDDAAVLITEPDRSLVVTTDLLVDGVHFSDRTTSPQDAGWRAVAANLSDLAAMGASPLGITVGLAITSELEVSWVEQLYQGMSECLQQYNTPIVGGDICRSNVVTLAITAFGQVLPDRVIQRRAAKPGYAIVITGIHGASRAGLELLLYPEKGQNLSNSDRAFLIQKHQRPQPRLDILPILSEILVPDRIPNLNSKIQIAGMDSSDGLADAILQICRLSSVGARIDRNLIPIPSALSNWLSPAQTIDWILYGGEDFELVLCLPYEKAQPLVQRLGREATIIGTITSEPTVVLVDSTGNSPDRQLTLNQGFQHF